MSTTQQSRAHSFSSVRKHESSNEQQATALSFSHRLICTVVTSQAQVEPRENTQITADRLQLKCSQQEPIIFKMPNLTFTVTFYQLNPFMPSHDAAAKAVNH